MYILIREIIAMYYGNTTNQIAINVSHIDSGGWLANLLAIDVEWENLIS